MRHVDRTGWPSGPWDDEDDVYEWRDDATGIECLILRTNLGGLCGYVGLPRGHPWYGQRPDADVHGGITWAEAGVGRTRRRDKLWWVGFDCAHAWDKQPAWCDMSLAFDDWQYRDVDYVRDEVRRLAAQAAAAEYESAPRH